MNFSITIFHINALTINSPTYQYSPITIISFIIINTTILTTMYNYRTFILYIVLYRIVWRIVIN